MFGYQVTGIQIITVIKVTEIQKIKSEIKVGGVVKKEQQTC